jgi:DNA sulfur modification protein DndE
LDNLLTATYTSTTEGERILRKLTRASGFTSENVIARLAVARSIKDPPISWAEELEVDLNGKQIRGLTLLGRQEVAVGLLAMIAEVHRAESPTVDDTRQLIRRHLDRGLRLLDSDIADRNIEDALLDYAAESLADGSPSNAVASVSPTSVLNSQVVGQQTVRKNLSALLIKSVERVPARISRLVGILGPDGFGRAHLARAVAASLQLPLIDLEPADCGDSLIDVLTDRLAVQGYAVETIKEQALVPACVIYIRNAEALGEAEYKDVGSAVSRTRSASTGRPRFRLLGGGVLLGARELPRDSSRIDLCLESYTRDEVAEIIKRVMGGWPLEVRRHLALAGRLTPGGSLLLAQEFQAEVRSRGGNVRPSETLLLGIMESKWGIDRLGLTKSDYQTLHGIQEGIISGDDVEQIDSFFFGRLGFIKTIAGGLTLTSRGAEALKAQGEAQ